MNPIETLKKEHQNIKTLVTVIRHACELILDGGAVNTEDFRQMIFVARHYADKHHHGKEELILFREMAAQLGRVAENLVKHGMLVEHDLGRLHLTQLEESLSAYEQEPTVSHKLAILTHATGWAELLTRHMAKEDEVVYTFAARHLPAPVLAQVERETHEFEAAHNTTREEALQKLTSLAKKYHA